MSSFVIEGGHPLEGEIMPQGAKNEALEVICAVLLTQEEVRIVNVPEILDVIHLIDLLKQIGVEVKRLAKGDYVFKASNINLDYVMSNDFAERCATLRGSVMLVGPMLARVGKAVLAKPGGDKIGRRKIDTHILGFTKLGATFGVDSDNTRYVIEAKKLKGQYMLLNEASITGTANIIMAAVLAEGETTIYNAACEPYIQQLCRMLIKMGAQITGVGSNLLTITGVSSLKGTTHEVQADMIEVGSFIGMSAILGGGLTIKNVSITDLGVIPSVFERMGIKLEYRDVIDSLTGIKMQDIIVPKQEHYQIETFLDGSFLTIDDAPWPGLTPDLLSVLIAKISPTTTAKNTFPVSVSTCPHKRPATVPTIPTAISKYPAV